MKEAQVCLIEDNSNMWAVGSVFGTTYYYSYYLKWSVCKNIRIFKLNGGKQKWRRNHASNSILFYPRESFPWYTFGKMTFFKPT